MVLRPDSFTESAQEVVTSSQELVRSYRHPQWDVEHVFLALLDQEEGVPAQILRELSVDAAAVRTRLQNALERIPKLAYEPRQIYPTPRTARLLQVAKAEADRLKDDYISTEHLFIGVVEERSGESAQVLRSLGVDTEKVYQALAKVRGTHRVTDPRAESRYRALERYSIDLTALARQGQLDPVVGRQEEVSRVIQTLSRRTKNNPVLLGEAGVGKTAIAEGLAQAIVAGDVPDSIQDRRVLALDMAGLVAGAKFRGEFEERLKSILDEIKAGRREIVLFIDEVHTVVGAGAAEGGIDASNMMKPALARGEIQVVGATTPDDYRKYIERDPALERRFNPIWIEEPSPETAIEMMHALKPRYEAHHKVNIDDDALVAAVRLSKRYIAGRHLPDKAVDLVDEAASKLRLDMSSMPGDLKAIQRRCLELQDQEEALSERGDYEGASRIRAQRLPLERDFTSQRHSWFREQKLEDRVGEENIASLVAKWTGVPVSRLLETEAARLLHMEESLHGRIIGQERAVQVVAEAIRRARAGLKDPKRPIGSFMFLGPTGVGKTELARSLADFLFDDEDAMVRIDMSEYMEQHTTSRLIGAPPGYVGYDEGGQLTEAVRRRPFRVVLFDEIEKAHPQVFNILLQVLDDGRLTDGHGRTVDFRNTVLILTSNLGTTEFGRPQGMGFLRDADHESESQRLRESVEDALKKAFRPEFLNRLDEVVIFDPLTREQIRLIVDLTVSQVQARLDEREITISLTDEARDWLAKEGFDPVFGARPLRRTVQRQIENPLSSRILTGEFPPGAVVEVDVDADGRALTFQATDAPVAVGV